VFSIQEILDLAIQLEHNAETLYRRAAAQHSDSAMASVLLRMADEERRHTEWFQHQQTTHALATPSEPADPMARKLLTDMVKDQQFSLANTDLTDVTEVAEMIRIFAEFEKDTIIFYKLLLPFVAQGIVKEELELIIDEESRHLAELNQILDPEAAEAKA